MQTNSIDGTWRAVSAELGGKHFPEAVCASIVLKIQEEKYTVTVGNNPDLGTIKLDTAAKPRTLDVTGVDGPNKGKTFMAIYDLVGDALTICYDLSGIARPTGFMTTEGTLLFLVGYKREKT